MPIEIHSSSDIDEHGEVRTRPRVTPHPVVRPGDCAYISQPEHLAAMLHLQLFRTSRPASTASSSKEQHDYEQGQGQGQEQEQGQQPETTATAAKTGRALHSSSRGQSKVQKQETSTAAGSKKLLGKEFLASQQKARLLLIEQSKKRHAKPVSFNKVSVQSEIRRQEAVLMSVLQEIQVTQEDKELQRATEKGVSGGIHARSEAKAEMALGRSLGPMLVPKSREEAVAWALKVATQPDVVLEKELFSVLMNIKKAMALFHSARPCSGGDSRSNAKKRSGSKVEFLQSMLENLQEPHEDDHLSLSEKLARQEKAGYSRFVHAIAPLPPTRSRHPSHPHTQRRTSSSSGKWAKFKPHASKRAYSPRLAGTLLEVQAAVRGGSGSQKSPVPPQGRRLSSAFAASPRNRPPRPESSASARPGSASLPATATTTATATGPSTGPSSQSVPARPKTTGGGGSGFKFTRAARQVVSGIKEAKEPALAKVVPLVTSAPLVFNDSALNPNLSTKMRSMSVLSVQINPETGEEEDVIRTKLSRVEESGGGRGCGGADAKTGTGAERRRRQQQHSAIEEGSEEEEEEDEDSYEDNADNDDADVDAAWEEDGGGSESTADIRLETAPAIKRYTNNPDFQWNSKECYHFNDMFGVDEFHEHAVKHFEQLHQNRDAAQQESRRVIADMAAASHSRVEKLLRRFVTHHELQESKLLERVQQMAQRDFDRPQVMKRLNDIINKKVHEGSLRGHVLDELREINSLVKHTIHAQQMNALMRHKWFLKIIQNLHEYKKKMKTPVPKSLIRFLMASCTLLENKWKIDKELFYELLEALLSPGDQKDVIVHRSLSIFRDEIGINSEQFSEFLQQKQVAACPELLVEVRQLHRKRDRQLRVIQTKQHGGEGSPLLTTRHAATRTAPLSSPLTSPLLGTTRRADEEDEEEDEDADEHEQEENSDPHTTTTTKYAASNNSNSSISNKQIPRLSESAPASLFSSVGK